MKNKCLLILLSGFLVSDPGALLAKSTTPKTISELSSDIESNDFSAVRFYLESSKSRHARKAREHNLLRLVANNGSVEMMQYLEDDLEIDIGQKTQSKETALHFAAQGGNLEMVQFLITDKKFNPKIKTDQHKTLLHYAAQVSKSRAAMWNPKSRATILYLVQEHGLKIDEKDDDGRTPLMTAMRHADIEAARCFQELGSKWLMNPEERQHIFSIAKFHEDSERDRFILESISNCADSVLIKMDHEEIEQLLFTATRQDDLNAFKRITELCSITAKDIQNSDLLLYALDSGGVSMVHYLLETSNAQLSVANSYAPRIIQTDKYFQNITALQWAAYQGNAAVVQYLIEERRMNPLEKNPEGYDTFNYALSPNGNTATLEYLIEKQGMDTGKENALGQTVLLQAVAVGNTNIVKYLIEVKKADPRAEDKRGQNIFQTAANNETLLYLLEKYNPTYEEKVREAFNDYNSAVAKLPPKGKMGAPDEYDYAGGIDRVKSAQEKLDKEKHKLRFP